MRPRSILITGASSGIGRALALEYARGGASVALSARRADELEAAAADVRAAGGRALVLPLDVTDAEAVGDAVRRADRDLGGLEMVVANAGRGDWRHGSQLRWEDVQAVLDVNVRGAMATLLAAVPAFLARQGGHLVAVTSLAGRRGLPMSAAYSASKAAMTVFLESLRIDLAAAGIRVTDVQPGFVVTPMTEGSRIQPRSAGRPTGLRATWQGARSRAPGDRVSLAARPRREPRPHGPGGDLRPRRPSGGDERVNAFRREGAARHRRSVGGEALARERLHLHSDSLPCRLPQCDDGAVLPEPREGGRVALQLGPRDVREGAMVVKMRPVVKAPEQGVQVVGREPEDVARAEAARVQAVGGVVDGPRCERLVVAEAEAERVQSGELTGDPSTLLRHDALMDHEDHARGIGAVDAGRAVPGPRWTAPRELVALAPGEVVEDAVRNDTGDGWCREDGALRMTRRHASGVPETLETRHGAVVAFWRAAGALRRPAPRAKAARRR